MDGRMDGRTENIYSIFRDKLLLLGEHVYGTEQGHFLGQEKLTCGHNKTNFGPDQSDILGQDKLILSIFKMNYRT